MNRYSLWKYLLIITITVIGLIYAAPNLFPSSPAVQVSAEDQSRISDSTIKQLQTALSNADVDNSNLEIKSDKLLFRFKDSGTQLKAQSIIKNTLGRQYVTALNLAAETPNWLRKLNALPMYLGLDLRGGVHFLMEVDMKTAIDKATVRYTDEFRSFLRKEKISYLGVKRENDDLLIQFKTEAFRDQAKTQLTREYRNIHQGGNELTFSEVETARGAALKAVITEEHIKNIKRFALQQNITTLRKRVNELGVAEPVIQQQGLERVVVQLPGVQDTVKAKEILGATATLEFRLVDEGNDAYSAQSRGRAPLGSKLYQERNGNPVLLKRKVMLTGEYITDAAAGFDQNQQPSVNITLDGKGSKIFSKATGENILKLMGVVFIETKTEILKQKDGTFKKKTSKTEEVINVARIQDQLSKRFQITGLDSPRESSQLALLLRAGALAAPIYIVEERTIGPSLGAENIKAGFMSVLIGFCLVLIFMAFYYKVFGLVANLALTLNLVLIIAVLSMLQATLTLPGIAGIVLTVGMAVDANVLIYERIKEELRQGVNPQQAIHEGYEKALTTISDANITTFIAAIVLFGMGTGPIKGFAITLAIGIACSMFTAIMGTRSIINLIYGNRKVTKLSI